MKTNIHELRIVITPFCNYRCFFCHGEGLTREYTPLLLSPKDYEFAVGACRDLYGWDTVTITGGEPLVSPIYRETCELLARLGVKVTTVTNGSLISSPKKILKDNAQVNFSLHSLNPETYHKITGTGYPLSQVLDTIISTRAQLPKLEIHLNITLIRGWNDTPEEMLSIIRFAKRINARAKFVDLVSENDSLVVAVEDIQKTLEGLGYSMTDENTWQIFMENGDDHAIITRCGFGKRYLSNERRSLFLNPDGVISSETDEDVSVSLLQEIHNRDLDGFAQKVEWYFPPAIRV